MTDIEAARIKEAKVRTMKELGPQASIEYALGVYDHHLASTADWTPVDPLRERAEKVWKRLHTMAAGCSHKEKDIDLIHAFALEIEAEKIPDDVRKAWGMVKHRMQGTAHSDVLNAFFGVKP